MKNPMVMIGLLVLGFLFLQRRNTVTKSDLELFNEGGTGVPGSPGTLGMWGEG
jgi:hypothetical protein